MKIWKPAARADVLLKPFYPRLVAEAKTAPKTIPAANATAAANAAAKNAAPAKAAANAEASAPAKSAAAAKASPVPGRKPAAKVKVLKVRASRPRPVRKRSRDPEGEILDTSYDELSEID